jgi:hypothetical protein
MPAQEIRHLGSPQSNLPWQGNNCPIVTFEVQKCMIGITPIRRLDDTALFCARDDEIPRLGVARMPLRGTLRRAESD